MGYKKSSRIKPLRFCFAKPALETVWLVRAEATHDDRSPADEVGQLMIKKVAGGYKVLSEKGKNLGGPYRTKKEAEKRLRQVEFFKHKK
jgi:hypothetical protein